MLKGTPTERKAIIARLEEALRHNPNSDIEATLNLLKDYAAIEKQLIYLSLLHDEILLKITNGQQCNENIDGLMIEFRVIPELMSNHTEIQKIKFEHDRQSKVKNARNYNEVNRDVNSYASKCKKCKNLKLNLRSDSKTGNMKCFDYCTDCYGVCRDCGKEDVFKISGIRQCIFCASLNSLSAQAQQSYNKKIQQAYVKTYPPNKLLLPSCTTCGSVLSPSTGKCPMCIAPCVTCGKKMTKSSIVAQGGECFSCYTNKKVVVNNNNTPPKSSFLKRLKDNILSLIR